MKRTVTMTRLADRHAEAHDRDFATTRQVTVEDDLLPTVVSHAMALAGFYEGPAFTIRVGEPHE